MQTKILVLKTWIQGQTKIAADATNDMQCELRPCSYPLYAYKRCHKMQCAYTISTSTSTIVQISAIIISF